MSKSKSRIKTKTGRFPTQAFKSDAENRVLMTKSGKTQKPAGLTFSGKKEPNEQAIIDAQRIYDIDKTIVGIAAIVVVIQAFSWAGKCGRTSQ